MWFKKFALILSLPVLVLAFISPPGHGADATTPPLPSPPALPSSPSVPSLPNIPTSKEAVLYDINSASKEELMAIPGIGEAYSKKIIAGRPYDNKLQLKTKKIIPAKLYDKIADMLIAKQKK
jgi:DNA uptake protein ComE-like DNA-binding protein